MLFFGVWKVVLEDILIIKGYEEVVEVMNWNCFEIGDEKGYCDGDEYTIEVTGYFVEK